MTKLVDSSHRELRNTLSLLTSITGRILQITDRKAGVALGAATNAFVGYSFVATSMAAVGSLGTASTGAAIAGLFGAAKSTATLYWIGGLVGGGVAAGTAVLGVGAVATGIYGSIKVRRALLGHARNPEDISELEQKILMAAQAMAASVQSVIEGEKAISREELAMFARIGVAPLVAECELALTQNQFSNLNTYTRTRLRGHIVNLKRSQKQLETP